MRSPLSQDAIPLRTATPEISLPPQTIAAIVVAAGRGERALSSGRVQAEPPKQYRRIGGRTLLDRAIEAMLALEQVALAVPVIHPEHTMLFAQAISTGGRVAAPVLGGETRQASVLNGLEALADLQPDLVLIHDAARPFADTPLVQAVVDALAAHDAALPAVAFTDTVKRSLDGVLVSATEDRASLLAAQTPQGFRFPQILAAQRQALAERRAFTDDAAVAEWAGLSVALTPGSTRNFKITRPEDFARAEALLEVELAVETRVGSGFDVHPFAPGDHVWLGGVRIPHGFALSGHSDADAGLHALADALYGALGEGDIGTHFPPTDQRWRGAASAVFLQHAARLVTERGGRIVNLDLTLVCEAPRIAPHVAAMREAIGAACSLAPSRVAVKATTSERLGFTGRAEGVVALATAAIEIPRHD